MKVEDLKRGMTVRINKPKYLDEYPYWGEEMDFFDGEVIKLPNRPLGSEVSYQGYLFSCEWLVEIDTTPKANLEGTPFSIKEMTFAISTVVGMMEQELAEVCPNTSKLSKMLEQIKCIAKHELAIEAGGTSTNP